MRLPSAPRRPLETRPHFRDAGGPTGTATGNLAAFLQAFGEAGHQREALQRLAEGVAQADIARTYGPEGYASYGYGYPAYSYASYGYPGYGYGGGYYRPAYRSAYYGGYRPAYRPAVYGGYRVARRVAIHRARWR